VETYPDSNDVIVMKSRVEKIRADIKLGDDPNVLADVNELIADFNDNPALPELVFVIGEEYYNDGFRRENEGLDAEAKDNFTKAISVWGKIMTKLPQSVITPQACYFSAVCYGRLRQHTKAIEYYQKVVDNWPDYKNASKGQFMVARIYEYLKRLGAIPESEANRIIKAAYERILQEYPDSRAANTARRKLKYHHGSSKGEQK